MSKDDEKLLICRVCISKVDTQEKSYDIFEKHEDLLAPGTSRDDTLIANKLTACADVKIKRDDGLPNRICSTCLLQLEDAYNFRKKCEKSDNILKTTLGIKVDSKYHEVPVKEESESDFFSDDTTSDSEDIKLKCKEPSVKDIKPKIKQQTDEAKSASGVQAGNNNSIVLKSKNLKLECPDCGQIFQSKLKLRVHRKSEHNNLPIACQYCKLQFKSFLAYHKHQKNRPKTCISLSNLRIEGVGSTRHFYCNQCQYNSKCVNNAIHHLVVHTKHCQFKCDQCDRSFMRVVTLRAHKERTHKHYYGQKTCHICGVVFQGFTLYDSHMRRHREKNKAQCEICNKTFASNSSLYTHKKTHSDLRAFACEKCPAKFRTSAGLNCHKKVHSGNALACKVCGYSVKNPYIVKKHESEHDHSNVACRVCGKFFESDNLLALHMKRHEDRGHPCGYCNKTYNARKILTEHLRKVHQIYVSSRTGDLHGLNIKKVKKKALTNLVE